MQDKDANFNVIRSVWRRTKKGRIKVRDLQAEKDVKGGGSVAGAMKTSSSIIETPLQNRLRAARDAMIRNLFEMPTERERKAREERINKAHVRFLRWLR